MVRTEKSIRLGLQPASYGLWALQSEAIQSVHEVLEIVLGTEPNPAENIPSTDKITAAQCKDIDKWINVMLSRDYLDASNLQS